MPSGSFPSSICSTIVGDREVSCKIRLTCVQSTLFAAAISSILLYLPDISPVIVSEVLVLLASQCRHVAEGRHVDWIPLETMSSAFAIQSQIPQAHR